MAPILLRSPQLRIRAVTCMLALLAATGVQGQWLGGESAWKEAPAGPPPAFDLARLIAVDGPGAATLRFGIDPATRVRQLIVKHSASSEWNQGVSVVWRVFV